MRNIFAADGKWFSEMSDVTTNHHCTRFFPDIPRNVQSAFSLGGLRADAAAHVGQRTGWRALSRRHSTSVCLEIMELYDVHHCRVERRQIVNFKRTNANSQGFVELAGAKTM